MSDYNGWSNYETWNVALWIDNEEGSYRHWRDQVCEALEAEQDRDDAVNTVSKALRAEIEDQMPELNGCYSDLLSAALSEVNWYEIAENWVDDYISEHPEVLESEDDEDEDDEEDADETAHP